MRCRPILLCCVTLSLLAAARPVSADWKVWTVAETRRVLREDTAEDAPAVSLAAARNEWESFQVVMRSDEPVGGVRIEAGDLRGPEGAVIPAAEARLYRQHQFQLTERTSRNDSFRPGWYPDALIPVADPMTGKPLSRARFTAVPFDLPANQTHGFWIDLHVPAGARPGQYRGVCRLTASGGKAVEVPVTLLVWDVELPRTLALQTEFGSPVHSVREYNRKHAPPGQKNQRADEAIEAQCAAMLAEHHINPAPGIDLHPRPQPDGTFRIPSDKIDALRKFVDRYGVNAVPMPHPSSAVKDPEKERAKLRAWLAAWDRAAKELDRPQVVFYNYLKDEPNDEEEYRYVQKWGRAVRQARSALKVLVVEQTKTQDPKWGDLNGAIDIWCPLFSLHDPATAAQRRALGETIWTYTALCQGKKTPWWHTDFPLLHYRVPAWIAWGQEMRGLLYWGGLSYWSQVDDPWTDPKTYRPKKDPKAPLFNGEGSIVYPALPVGYRGIAPSLRLKALRDGIEDFEYLMILQRAGRRAEAEKLVLPLAGSYFKWDPDPGAYEKARRKLAELIVSLKR